VVGKNNNSLPIVVEPVEAKSITDLTTVAKSNTDDTDLSIGVEPCGRLELTWDQALFYKYSLTQTLINPIAFHQQQSVAIKMLQDAGEI
jgi:hypothetical protein